MLAQTGHDAAKISKEPGIQGGFKDAISPAHLQDTAQCRLGEEKWGGILEDNPHRDYFYQC